LANLEQPAALLTPVYLDRRKTRTFGSVVRTAARLGRRNKLGAAGVVLVVFILGIAILAPVVQRYGDTQRFETANPDFDPVANPLDIAKFPEKQLGSPTILTRYADPLTADHWLGTDQFGRDIYARIIVGTRLAVIIGVGASLIAVVAGTVVGVISGYFGGKLDLVLQRLDQPNLALTVAALGFLGFASSVRIVRSAVLSVSQMSYVEAARSYGAVDARIMARHVLPNIIAPVLVIFSISIGLYILAEASLSFLGLGPADKTTWGKMVNAGRQAIDVHPWESVFSGAAITLTVLAFNLAGDALRDELDPRLRGR